MIEKILEPYISERFMSDARYRKGHIRIINPLPGTSVLGLHIPDMRKVASQLAASDDAVGLIGQFEAAPERSLHYEEYMVWGMMLNRIKLPLEERLERVRAFVPHIDNWAVCDCVCADARWARPDGRTWDFIRSYLSSGREFEVRFGLILYMSRMMEESSLPEIFKRAWHGSWPQPWQSTPTPPAACWRIPACPKTYSGYTSARPASPSAPGIYRRSRPFDTPDRQLPMFSAVIPSFFPKFAF